MLWQDGAGFQHRQDAGPGLLADPGQGISPRWRNRVLGHQLRRQRLEGKSRQGGGGQGPGAKRAGPGCRPGMVLSPCAEDATRPWS
jgi:hypothetical protein